MLATKRYSSYFDLMKKPGVRRFVQVVTNSNDNGDVLNREVSEALRELGGLSKIIELGGIQWAENESKQTVSTLRKMVDNRVIVPRRCGPSRLVCEA